MSTAALSSLSVDWKQLEQEHADIQSRLADPSLEKKLRIDLSKKASIIANLLDAYNQVAACEKTIQECTQQLADNPGDMAELYKEELEEATAQQAHLYRELEDLLYPSDERDNRSVFLEIRAGTGGQEAALFVVDLLKMYTNYALTQSWETSIAEATDTDLGGYKEVVLHIKGKKVYRQLKFESGVHRVQRVPKTETAGRIHTSTVTVVVLPEADDVDITINPADLRVDTYRSSGAGGQHVNTTDSAIRITHIPTGLVVCCQDERSQIKNRAKAMKILQSRILQAEQDKREAEISAARKQQAGTGERAEKVRTYNFPQNRVTDHRTDMNLKKLDMVMQGDLGDLVAGLLDWDMAQRRAQGISFSTT